MGFDIFIAHDDIKPSLVWQQEILKNLKQCDIFIPFLTKNFKESNWTDQETGIAFLMGKHIIPLKVDYIPYGFINKYQGLKFDSNNIETMAEKIKIVILENKKIKRK